MRRVFGLLIIVLLLIAGDTAARTYTGAEIEDQLAGALNLGDEPRVDIKGFPFLTQVFRGRFDVITVSSDRVATQEIELTDVRMTLNEVRFSAAKAIGGRLRKVRIDSARGQGTIASSTLEAALSNVPANVRPFIPDDSTLDIQANELVLGPVRIGLPVIAEEMQYESAEVIDGAVHLIFRLSKTVLRL